jgi:hypothetical protein
MGKRKADPTVVHTSKHVKVSFAGYGSEGLGKVQPCICVLNASSAVIRCDKTPTAQRCMHHTEAALLLLAFPTVVSHLDQGQTHCIRQLMGIVQSCMDRTSNLYHMY